MTSETLYVFETSGGQGRTLDQMFEFRLALATHYDAAARLQMGSLAMAISPSLDPGLIVLTEGLEKGLWFN